MASSCEQSNTKKQAETVNNEIAVEELVVSQQENNLIAGKEMNKYVGIYEYVYPYSSEENQYIVLKKENGKIIGFYYGTSDEFDEAREGYLPAFFVLPMNQLEIKGDTIEFVLTVENNDYLTKSVDLEITTTQEAMELGYENWENYFPTESKKYIGIISTTTDSIFFKGEVELIDKKFVKLTKE